MSKLKEMRKALVVRYYKDEEKTTEEDYIAIYISCRDFDANKYYWGLSSSWDYKSMNKYSELNNGYDIAEELFVSLWRLGDLGYEIKFQGRKIKEGKPKWEEDWIEED